jgi:predicted DNA-binding protein YlxM (UPF0122 family)
MAKLTEAQKNQIRVEYAAGASNAELAKKFQVSHTAISKILKNIKSSDNTKKVSNRERAKSIISKAYEALENNNYSKTNPETLLKIIERITAIYGREELEIEDEEQVTEILIEIEDASGNETEN